MKLLLIYVQINPTDLCCLIVNVTGRSGKLYLSVWLIPQILSKMTLLQLVLLGRTRANFPGPL